MTQNPLFSAFTGPFGLAPFSRITPEHFREAFPKLMADELAEVEAIAGNPEAPSFANTIEALEKTGERFSAAAAVFYNLAGAHTNEALQAVEREVAPAMARHGNAILLNEKLFARIDALNAQGLTPEQARVLELTQKRFIRAGAKLSDAARARMKEISERLAVLTTQFTQNVLAEEKGFVMPVSGEAELKGLPGWLRDAAAAAAKERGMDGHVITLSRSLIEPFLQFSENRELREKAFRAWSARGENGNAHDNRAIANEILKLRAERAKLLGFADFASFKLENQMAKNPANVRKLLMQVWEAAVARAGEEEEKLQGIAAEEGGNFALKPWDWRHYAEKLRMREHDLDTGLLKPYLQLENIIAAAFHVAGRLFGLSFEEVKGLDLHYPDARAFEVKKDGRHVALFIGDYFARPSKRSGAWMSSFRSQHKLKGEVRPIIVNVMNFAKAPEGKPCLLTLDDARTLFHEFGHALHGMMSDVTYPSIAGTSVARDFVELPSQLYEHWFLAPEILAQFATHAETGAPMPKELIDRVIGASTFNQGFATVEYTSSALVDLALHERDVEDVMAVEAEVLKEIGMPQAITMRHRVPHFTHVFSGDGYSAGYYSYMWSEVMDADAFAAFEETGDLFNAEIAGRLAGEIYSAGGRKDPAEAYIAFRGRLPETAPMLRKRGLAARVA